MSKRTLCRLCFTLHEEYKSLFDGSGQGNNIYTITLKYFDPMLLTPDSEWDSTVICLACWHHIDDFYEFQQTILQTQSNLQTLLQADVKEPPVHDIEIEDHLLVDQIMPIKMEDDSDNGESSYNADVKETVDEIKIEEHLLVEQTHIKMEDDSDNVESSSNANSENYMPNADSHDIKDDILCNTSDEDDMKPLIFHITKLQKSNRDSSNIPNNEYNGNESDVESTTKKLRKLKTSMKKAADVPKPNRKIKIKESAKEIPKSKGVSRRPPINEQSSNEMGDSNGVEKTKWPCDICGAQLRSHTSRKRHKQLKHNDGTTAYICSECGKAYTSEPALLSHKRMAHIRELKFKCNYCEKAFKTPRHLREHIATHTGIDIYQCPHCPKTFKMSSNMHHHRKKMHPIQ